MKSLQLRGLKAFFSVTLLFAVFFVPSGNCWAHAFLLESNPADQQVLERSPSQIWLRFSEPLQEGLFQVRLIDAQGREIRIQPHLDPKDAARIVSLIPSLPDGSYTIAWNVVSEDGHPVGGAISFSVGPSSSAKAPPSLPKNIQPTDWLSATWHFVSETAVILIGGLNWVAWWFSRNRLPALSSLVKRRTIQNGFLFFVVIIDGVLYVLSLPSFQWDSGGTWLALADSHYIQMIVVQLVLLLLVALPNMIEGWYLAIWLFLILSLAIGGHVWSTANVWVAWLLREFHLVSMALWLGILTYLLLLYRWKRKANLSLDEEVLHSNVFYLAATAAVILLVTGFWMVSVQSGWRIVTQVTTLWTSFLWAKIALFIGMLSIAFVQTMIEQMKQTYNRSLLRLEWLFGILALFAGVWLSHSAFPVVMQHYEQTLTSQQKQVQVEIARLQVGQQPITVLLPSNSPVPERMTVRISVPEKQVTFSAIALKEKGLHRFVGIVPFRFPGTWQMEIEAEYTNGTYTKWIDYIEIPGGEGL